MKKILKNQVFRNFLSAILFSLIYSFLSFAEKGSVKFSRILGTTALYFLILCLLYALAPKLRKIMGHDQSTARETQDADPAE